MKILKKIMPAVLALALCTAPIYASAADVSEASAVSGGMETASSENTETTSSEVVSAAESSSESSESSELSYLFSDNTTGNADLVAYQEVLSDSDKFQFIAVTTRSGDVFYIIIDKMKAEDNVYFLNEVDTYDLQTLMNGDESDSSGSTDFSSDSENSGSDEAADSAESESDSQSDDSSLNNILLLGGIAAVAVLGFIIFKIKKGGKNKNTAIPLDDDFEEDEEVNEDKENKE